MLRYDCDSLSTFGWAYTKIGTIQRRLAWPLRKDDTQNREAFHIFLCPQNQIMMRKYEIVDGDDPFGVHFPKINKILRTDYISNGHRFDTPQSQK